MRDRAFEMQLGATRLCDPRGLVVLAAALSWCKVSKTFRLTPGKLAAAQRILATTTATETIETALDMVVQDVIKDGFIPVFGTGDPLQVGFLLAYAAHFSTRADIETVNGARLMRLADYGLQVGGRADLVVVEAPSVQEAYGTQPPRRFVVHEGRLVAERGRVVAE